MGRKDSKETSCLSDKDASGVSEPVARGAAARLRTVAAILNLPVEAFLLSRSSVTLQRVFATREDEVAEVLRLYFAVDDIATRMRYLELLRSLSAPEVKVAGE